MNSVDPLRERLLARELAWAREILVTTGCRGLIDGASGCLVQVASARRRFEAVTLEFETAPVQARSLVVDRYLRVTNTDAADLRDDLRALRRGDAEVLDLATLGERFARASDEQECRAEACLAVARLEAVHVDAAMIERLLDFAITPGRWARRVEAIRSIASLGRRQRTPCPERALATLAALMARGEHRWVQVAAFAALAALDSQAAYAAAHERLRHPGKGDDFLVRAGLVSLVGLRRRNRWPDLLALAHDDASELVRITAARVQADPAELARVARADPSHRVRASALIRISRKHASRGLAVLREALTTDPDGFVVRTAAEELTRLGRRDVKSIHPATLAALASAADRASLPAAAGMACGDALVELHTLLTSPVGALDALREAVRGIPDGGSVTVREAGVIGLPDDALAPALAMIARDDLGVGVDRFEREIVVHRGERRVPSVWRTVFEFLHPTPSKRQGVSHTVSRRARGALRSPPGGLAEVTATRVPGERVLSAMGGGWGRELPRVEDLLGQSLTRTSQTRIASARGVTIISSPRSLGGRLKGFFALVLGFSRFAALRQRSVDSDDPYVHGAYAREILRKTGTSVQLVPYGFDAEVRQQDVPIRAPGTPVLLLPPLLSPESFVSTTDRLAAAWQALKDSSGAVGEVGLPHLAGYGALVLGALVARQVLVRREIARERATIPLVIGGWGTRGKSGTERLKAALFQGLGFECLVKTTGCEAMFIHATPGLPAREIFINRPYDKATVWEQHTILKLAAQLRVRVFLWECMALQPDLVNLLQLQWMQDDQSTITNTYPDHEDLQGPTGRDVAETIGEFLPRNTVAFTTEQQMLPILKMRAATRGTRLVCVSPRESELIAGDLLARFGHAEHPSNIALVAALARRAGVPQVLAIAEMADHVVSDLGALKTFPTAQRQGRTLSFTNGMGANDRAATLENWQRAGFETAHRERARGWVMTLVNNRADRPARTAIFADLLVKDIVADRHVLIGTNLSGMRRSIERALGEHTRGLAPSRDLPESKDDHPRVIRERIEAAFARLSIVGTAAADVADEAARLGLVPPDPNVLEELLEPYGAESYELAHSRIQLAAAHSGLEQLDPALHSVVAGRRVLRALLSAASAPAAQTSALDRQFAHSYRAIFLARVVTLPDPKMSGDALIDALALQLPPGATARIMGMQNIKGTGLDFVYRWVSLETVTRLCSALRSESPVARRDAVVALMVHDDYGVMDATIARDAVADLAAGDSAPALLAARQKLDGIVALREKQLARGQDKTWQERFRQVIGRTLDFVDAVRRRGITSRVLRALVAAQISHATAAHRMRRTLSRSNGAWLLKDD